MISQRGFSLLEVLVAFAILAATLGVLMSIFSLSTRSYQSAHNRQLALTLAQSKLAELAAQPRLNPGSDSGRLEGSFRWTSRVRPYTVPEAFGPFELKALPFEARVTVSWGDKDSQQVSLDTLLLGRPL
ncbi:type IV pilus modification PilV family protein [Gallaecimonas xiamenensis]|uniref:General secretion pathway protein H n=1 Tax=Gallaecimonas xiamenensis 3-C-1 TaxID=745411 RepID=K2JZY6_9GAMM|nr:prepilin-type N-terminal cleavage/methylation domain-containing protein [Gallaecimonas xiamenensis]EKE75974.1 general secretion pathway protein H [Gallaecimonas xiamenensis 3-C-1]